MVTVPASASWLIDDSNVPIYVAIKVIWRLIKAAASRNFDNET